MTNISFKVKGPHSGHIGLLADVKTQFHGQPFYEIIVGGWSNKRCSLRKVAYNGNPVVLSDAYSPGHLSNQEFRPFWLSWANHVITLGKGSLIGENVIYSYDDKAATMPINHLAFSSWNNIYHQFKYYNVQPLHFGQADVCYDNFSRMAPLTDNTINIINDNDTTTCFNITLSAVQVSYLPLLIHEKFPVKIKLLLKSTPSCDKGNIVVFTSSKLECPLVRSGQEDGAVACVYSCSNLCSTRVTVGFIKQWDMPQSWSLCEVVPLQ